MSFTLPSFQFGQKTSANGVRLPSFQFGYYSSIVGIALPSVQFGAFKINGLVLPEILLGESGPSTYSMTASGGVKISGSAYIGGPLVMTGSGGMKVGGAAIDASYNVTSLTVFGNGGVNVTGAAIVRDDFYVASGGVKVGGYAVVGGSINPAFSSSLSATLPVITGSITGDIGVAGSIDATIPRIESSVSVLVGITGSLDATFPGITSQITGGIESFDAVLPLLTAQINGYVGASGSVDATIPTISGSVTGQTGVTGAIDAELPVPTGSMNGTQGIIGQIGAMLPAMSGEIIGATGVGGSIGATLGLISASFTGYLAYYGAIDAKLKPMTAFITGTVGNADQWHVMAMNLKTGAISEYQGYQFNSMVEFNGRMIGASASGLFFLDGSSDNGAEIHSSITTGKSDFGAKSMKRLTDAYLSCQSTEPVTLTVEMDEHEAYDYDIHPEDSTTMRQHKADLGRGMKSRYYQFIISNTVGSDMELDSLEVVAETYSRRM
jgi:hypothetical protein